MLVAVGLVVLMMTLFATIFQFATQSMAIQKGTAENDQKVRLVMTLLRSDLNNRTMKLVLPFRPNDLIDEAYESAKRKGYLYISENDPDDDIDDVLQFTVGVSSSDDPFYGRAKLLAGDIISAPQQPEFDDGFSSENGAGGSSNAEVAYFLRHGTLYRRVMLLRDPIVAVNTGLAHPYNPQSKQPLPLPPTDIPLTEYQGGNVGTKKNFYSDFDYSAHYDATGPAFHGVDDLVNSSSSGTFPLGKPNYRYGFNQANGLPREFTSQQIDSSGATVNTPRFFGRFTQGETSYFVQGSNPFVSFGYPGRVTADSPNPYDETGRTLTYDTRTGQITEYSTGSRVAEDILMTGVKRFDIKVFDEGASLGPDNALNGPEIGWPGSDDGEFRDLGHNGFLISGNDVSFYSKNKVPPQTLAYRPANPLKPGTFLYRFDTWHPNLDLDPVNPPNGSIPPPFRRPDLVAPPVGEPAQRPLRAIQIRISFFDQTSQQLRDVTFVQSLAPAN